MYKPNVQYSPLQSTPLLSSHNNTTTNTTTTYNSTLGPRAKNDGWNTLDPDSPLKLSDQHILRQVQQQAWWLDRGFRFCGLAVGLDGIIGLVPVIGDLIGAFFSLHLIRMACQIDLPRHIIFQMVLNVLADFLIGLVPVVGDILDAMFCCNIRNAQMIENHLLSNALQPEQGMVENERSSSSNLSSISSDVIKSQPTDKPPCSPARASHMTTNLLTPTPSVCQEHDTFENIAGSLPLDQPHTPPSEPNTQLNCLDQTSVDAALVNLLKAAHSDGDTLGDMVQSDMVQSDIGDSPQSASRTSDSADEAESDTPREEKSNLNPLVSPNRFVGKRQAFSFSVGCQDALVECSPFNKFVTAKQKKIIQKSGNPTDLLVALYNPITPEESTPLPLTQIVDPTKINLQERIILRRESKNNFRKPLRRSAKC
ncbi:hypothetical protein CLU79DRAFT_765006 [Phycomyces nitens]|nr:hypothetical protein CLU79DRAFT_765006 [Phycomyces nitens]